MIVIFNNKEIELKNNISCIVHNLPQSNDGLITFFLRNNRLHVEVNNSNADAMEKRLLEQC